MDHMAQGFGNVFRAVQIAANATGATWWLPWIGFAAGLLLVLQTAKSVINTIILPRMVSSRITYRSWQLTRAAIHVLVDRLHNYEAKDRVLAYLGPISMLVTLLAWLLLFLLGYALMFWPLVGNLGAALYLSGSSLFTLGVASTGHPAPIALEFGAAATGLIVIALQIGYLPTIYGAYNRRETLVTSLNSRASAPAWGPEILARHQLSEAAESLPAMYAAWETLAADIAESHTSYPWLMAMRSPSHLNSWVISLLAVLDSAALYITLCPSKAPVEARQCLRMGFIAMRALAHVQQIPVDDDPRPDDPIQLPFERFAFGVDHLRRNGFPLERTAEQAWRDFKGWRVNYEAAAYGIADAIVAVPAPWSGKRSHMNRQDFVDVLAARPRHRTPDDPEGKLVLEKLVRLPDEQPQEPSLERARGQPQQPLERP
jgi:hypothetical protein